MAHDQTKTVCIVVDSKIRYQIDLDHPARLTEVWRLPIIIELGPNRFAKLGPDGIAYVLVDSDSFETWKLITELSR